jgi:hypothetical protein
MQKTICQAVISAPLLLTGRLLGHTGRALKFLRRLPMGSTGIKAQCSTVVSLLFGTTFTSNPTFVHHRGDEPMDTRAVSDEEVAALVEAITTLLKDHSDKVRRYDSATGILAIVMARFLACSIRQMLPATERPPPDVAARYAEITNEYLYKTLGQVKELTLHHLADKDLWE